MNRTYPSRPPAVIPPRTTTAPAPGASIINGLLALSLGLIVFGALLITAVLSFEAAYEGKIYPGVTAAGIDLTGMTPAEAAILLAQRLDYPLSGKIDFQEGQTVWSAKPFELGLFLDSQATALAAYQVGRQGGIFHRTGIQLNTWLEGRELSPLLVYDERAAQFFLQGLAAQIDKPVVEASLAVDGVGVKVQPGQVGRALDIPAAQTALSRHLGTMSNGTVPLSVIETPPAIMDVSEQAEIVRKILSASMTLRVPNAEEGDPGPWTFDPPVLAGLLAIERVDGEEGARYQVGLNSESLRPMLESAAPQLSRESANARFIFNDDTRELELIQEAVIGRHLDIDQTIQTINQKAAAGEHDIELVVAYTSPEVPTHAKAADFGITELVSSNTSYFYGSSGSRIQNITTAASRFHGVMVAPGETFSMAEVLGTISLDEGYAEALIIYGGRTIQGVGGGVCQVSTALFRTVFFGGFPIMERYPHAYRVGYYEQVAGGGYNARLAGLDATVFVPVVDFKFKNDTAHWILMETYVNAGARTLTWKFYSTSDGRSVEWDTTGPRNIVKPPPPLYEENAELRSGEIKQVDWAAEGADVSVTRTVRREGEVLYNSTFTTNYMPWRAVYQYGPGTDIPEQDED
jgi:vancomycin resistance protein YoaR